MFHDSLLGTIEPGDDASSTKKQKAIPQYRKSPEFKQFMGQLEHQRSQGFPLHPKMEKLKALLIDYFISVQAEEEEGVGANARSFDDTRVMVFVSFRHCVEEIVEFLDNDKPLIRATKFIGQGTDKAGNKGFAQKTQLEVS